MPAEEGRKAPDFKLPSSAGKTISLGEVLAVLKEAGES
jgi:peroxiredoxin